MSLGTRAQQALIHGLSLFLAASAAASEGPIETGPIQLQEKMQVRIIQIEVTVWPERDEAAACRGLGADDFDLLVDGLPRPILEVDRPGRYGEVSSAPAGAEERPAPVAWPGQQTGQRPSAAAPLELRGDPMQFVFYFDLWHLNSFVTRCHALTQPLAFSYVRHMLQETFQPGDRMMLASFAGRPLIHTAWIDDRERALQALDDLEVAPGILMPNRGHLRLDRWVQGWRTLFQALGRSPGRKHLFYLGDDLDWSPTPSVLYGLVGLAQLHHVLVHAVDLIWSCRTRDLLRTRYDMPLALGTLPFHTGGRLFGGGQTVARAVNTLRRLQGCQFLLSFRAHPADGRRRAPRVRVRLREGGARLAAPVSYRKTAHAPVEAETEPPLRSHRAGGS
ncbi:MAG: VWA domain-containing protein [Acidobacteriota bacterium]